MIIGGEAVKSSNFFDVHNPATVELVGKCPIADKSDLDAAVDAARAAFPAWSALADEERQGLCHAIGQVIEDNAEEIAHLLTREHGKPLNLSLIHISEPTRRYAISYAVFCLELTVEWKI